MDVTVCRETLYNLLEALRVLEETDEREENYRQLLAALPTYATNAEGGLREWMHADLADVQTHRHMSHLYGLFPSWEINPEDTPEIYAQAVRALELRQNELSSMAGWSFAFMANLWARSGQGERALENLEMLLRSCTTPNLLTWHNDWRAQGLSMYWGQGAQPPFKSRPEWALSQRFVKCWFVRAQAFCTCFPPYQMHGPMETCGESRHGVE